jgi:hypothetical protein
MNLNRRDAEFFSANYADYTDFKKFNLRKSAASADDFISLAAASSRLCGEMIL